MQYLMLEFMQNCGLESVILGAIICALTGILKKPIKNFAVKSDDGAKYTKYITFLPVLLGVAATSIYYLIFFKNINLNGEFIKLWLSSSSISLAIYAFLEKFIPSKNTIMSKQEISQNNLLLQKLNDLVNQNEIPTDVEDKNLKTGKENIIDLNDSNKTSNETKDYIENFAINTDGTSFIKTNDSLNVSEVTHTKETQKTAAEVEKIVLRGKKND